MRKLAAALVSRSSSASAPQPNAATRVSMGRNRMRLSDGYSMNSAQAM